MEKTREVVDQRRHEVYVGTMAAPVKNAQNMLSLMDQEIAKGEARLMRYLYETVPFSILPLLGVKTIAESAAAARDGAEFLSRTRDRFVEGSKPWTFYQAGLEARARRRGKRTD